MVRYFVTDHTADVGLTLEAASIAEMIEVLPTVFQQLFLAELPSEAIFQRRYVAFDYDDLEEIIPKMIDEFIYILDVYHEFTVSLLSYKWRYNRINLELLTVKPLVGRLELKMLPKAATRHNLRLDKVEDRIRLTVIVDV